MHIFSKIRRKGLLYLLLGFLFGIVPAFGQHETAKAGGEENNSTPESGFNAGEFIIDHVTDKYEWHLWGPHENPVSIPLPVILYSSTKGLSVFLSSKFEHGHAFYDGYKMEEGAIVSEGGSEFYNFSITKAVTGLLITSILVLWLFISVAKSYSQRKGQAPKGIQSLLEPIIVFVRDDIAKASISQKYYMKYMPLLLTLFFFIWISNFIGLIPTFPGVMGNISVAFTLAAIVLVLTLFIGKKHYWQHIIWMPGVPAWVKISLLTPIEILGVLLRPAVLMIRIFANIAAGQIVILSFVCLIFVFGATSDAGGWGFSPISMLFALFMNAMELLVAFLQAFVFTLLTAMYIGACVEEPHHAEH